jgi:hypothetical protein
MQKSEDAAILMKLNNDKIKYLVGNSELALSSTPLTPYADIVCDFLNNLSALLMHDVKAKQFPDVISFAFWCRKANILRLKEEFAEKHFRIGLGKVFHIAPSNVPVNFAFSYAFSLLAGNANMVRVPGKEFAQVEIICNAMNQLLPDSKYQLIAGMTAFVKYDHDDDITASISSQCNARVIWGGDATIRNIRMLPVPVRSIEIAFADRYSFCAIDAHAIDKLDLSELGKLANAFYNDTYLMDQNACSSPNLVVWIGQEEQISAAKEKFWKAVVDIVSAKYELQPIHAIDKYTKVCEDAIDLTSLKYSKQYGNYLYCIGLRTLQPDMDTLRGKCGYFYEFDTNDLNRAAHIINTKYQTLTYFGIAKSVLLDFVQSNSLQGIDRIVPIGTALDISVIWDGYDLIRTLSRIIDIK